MMEFAHRMGVHAVHKEVSDTPSLLLTNRRGSFFYWADAPSSRYQGFYVRRGNTLVRSLVGFRLSVGLPVRRVTNYFSHFEVERSSGFTERFFLDPATDSLLWEGSEAVRLDVHVDGKEIFDNDEWERSFRVSDEAHTLVIEFEKRAQGRPALRFFLALAGDWLECSVKKEWMREEYERDRARKDPPFSRYVFRAAQVKARRVVCAVSDERETAKRNALALWRNAARARRAQEAHVHRFAALHRKPVKSREAEAAYLAAKFSLSQMVVRAGSEGNGSVEGMYAGLPWLSQFWLRDFVMSARQLDPHAALSMFRGYLSQYVREGRIIPSTAPSCLAYADTEGLFFLAAARFLAQGALTEKERAEVKGLCVRFVDEELPQRMKGGFVWNGPKETWMDTEYMGSARAGVRIEIQALAARTLSFAHALTGKRSYADRHDELLRNVREGFWDGEKLRDGLGDTTSRPNVFLAFHFAPELLFAHEWAKAFKSALSELWLLWGGIATLPKTHPLFCGTDRGCSDPNQSYHHGDSWFFVNSLAASALFQTDPKGFKPFIDALLDASTEDILWKGMLGYHSEVSSADAFSPSGCLAQSWSAATYCDAIDTVLKSKLR